MTNLQPTRDDLDAILRRDLTSFIEKSYRTVAPGADYHANWHIEAIAHELTRCADGKTRRLILTVPPRHLKSICASVAFPAWLLGRNPACNVVCVSYSNELAAKHARDCRSIVEAEWYKRIFGSTRISRDKNAVMEFVTTRNGGRFATSVEGTMTGRGGDVIIIDDPIKPDSATSEAERQRVNEWFQRTLYTRLNNRNDGVIIIVMQRVHEDDLVGHVLELDDWTVLNIPAIATERMEYRIGPDPEDVHVREENEVIDPRRQDREALAQLKRMLGSYNFAAQYQQNPVPVEGNLVKREWFQSYSTLPRREEMDAVVLSWDTATAAGELNDFSVCTVWGVLGKRYYLMDVIRRKLDYPDLRALALLLVDRHAADIVVVEDVGTGTSLCQELRRSTSTWVFASKPVGDKEIRFAAQSAIIEQRRVFLPKEAPWLDAFMKELLGFPGAKHDDQVDSVELFLRFANHRRGGRIIPAGGPRERPPSRRSRPFNVRRYLDDKLRSDTRGTTLCPGGI
jgi:predicted phage terminase large subunit-like protein